MVNGRREAVYFLDIRALAGRNDTPTHRIYCSIPGNMNNTGIYKNRVSVCVCGMR